MDRRFRRWTTMSLFAIALIVMVHPTFALQSDQERETLEDWQQDEVRALQTAVGAALEGSLVQSEDLVEFTPKFMKGNQGQSYIPFTLTVDQSNISESTVVLYVLVTPPCATGTQSEVTEAVRDLTEVIAEVGDIEPPSRQCVALSTEDVRAVFENATYEDAFFVDVSETRSAGGPIEISRAFHAPGGVYDVYFAIRDSKGEDADDDDRANSLILMVKKEVEVPEFWDGKLHTSSVIVAKVIDTLDRPLSPEELVASPYTVGLAQITPKIGESFGKDEVLSLIMLVYDPSLGASEKPDITINYDFNYQTDDGEQFFNRTSPKQYNGQTLPPNFDLAEGHNILEIQSVPLGSFPSGDYRLEIKLTDNVSGDTLLRDVNFIVTD